MNTNELIAINASLIEAVAVKQERINFLEEKHKLDIADFKDDYSDLAQDKEELQFKVNRLNSELADLQNVIRNQAAKLRSYEPTPEPALDGRAYLNSIVGKSTNRKTEQSMFNEREMNRMIKAHESGMVSRKFISKQLGLNAEDFEKEMKSGWSDVKFTGNDRAADAFTYAFSQMVTASVDHTQSTIKRNN